MPLAEQEFDLEPGNGFSQDVRIEMPASLAPGIYGLALVVYKPSGPVVNVIPVQVGTDEQEPFHGEWPTEAALEACPAPQTADVEPTPTASTEPQAQVTYTEVEVIGAGLQVEVPDSWQQLSTGWAWSPVGEGLPQIGVAWRDLQPPEEPEAALLPSPSQVLASEPIDLSWGSGRRVTLEVYAPGAEDSDSQAPVQSVQTHVLIVVQEGASRRAYDLVAAAGSLEELTAIEPIFQHLLDTARLAH